MRHRHVALLLLVVLCTVFAGHASADDAADIRACYDQYKKAILDQDGAAAVEKVDQKTLDYYGRMRDLAVKAPAADVRKLPLMDKLMILSMRHRVPADTVIAMNAETAFVHAVKEGWIGKDSVRTNALGKVTVNGPKAEGDHITNGITTPLKWTFNKENGAWKLNLTDVMPTVEKTFQTLAAGSGQSDDEFLTSILQLVSGKAVPETVWEPLQP